MPKSKFLSSSGDFQISNSEKVPIWRKLYDEIRDGIVNGRLQPGDRLMSTRTMAEQLGISRVTVLKAFDQLQIEGYLNHQVGSGTYVNRDLPDHILQILTNDSAIDEETSYEGESVTSFGKFYPGVPDIDEFPFEKWSRITTNVVRNLPASTFNSYHSLGYPPLRNEISKHLRKYRGLSVTADQILITSGITDSLSKVILSLFDRGDVIWMGDPTYGSARDLFMGLGLQVKPLDLQSDRIISPAVNGVKDKPSAIYVTPSHQYPLGGSLSIDKRLQLIEIAKKYDAYIIEDDYDSVYRFTGAPLRALHGLSKNQPTIYLGTMSKILFLGLRISFIVLPASKSSTVFKYQKLTNKGLATLDQAILAEFMRKGHLDQHIRKMRMIYASRNNTMVHEFRDFFSNHMYVMKTNTGIHFVAVFNDDLDDVGFVDYAKSKGFHMIPLSSLYINKQKSRKGLVIGYGNASEKMIRSEVKLLSNYFNDWLANSGSNVIT